MDIFDMQDVAKGIREQAKHVANNDAPVTARICLAQLALLNTDTQTGRRLAAWPGKVLADALPLRLAGGLHHLHLTGADNRLSAIYDGRITDQAEIDEIICAVVTQHDDAMLPWFDSPPQTNEAGRSASFMAGLKWLSGKIGPRFELNELGASAGINSMMDRYHYDLGGVLAGPPDSPMQIKPEWRGPPPPDQPVKITAIHACDQNPIDLSDPDAALRVKSYVWPENHDRLARMDAAILLAAQKSPEISRADAADWVEARLAAPQQSGVTRVFNHSIVWQYISDASQKRITNAIEAAGRAATAGKPIAWMSLETNRSSFRHELHIRYWPGGEEAALLGQAQAHGSWLEWFV